MGRQSTRANKNIYQICREECELTRERASEMMTGVSASRIEKIEYNLQDPTPYDIVQMADCYKRPNECYNNFIKNTFCRILFLTLEELIMSHQNPPDATRVSRIFFYIIRTLRNLQDMELQIYF